MKADQIREKFRVPEKNSPTPFRGRASRTWDRGSQIRPGRKQRAKAQTQKGMAKMGIK
jgi:hypothetical protein